MAMMFWKNKDRFIADLGSADDQKLRAMYDWVRAREASADRSGMGRNPKARRMWRRAREAAEDEMSLRRLL